MLRKNAAAGRYDTGTRGDVAKLMTEDLLAVHKDGHLHGSSCAESGASRDRARTARPPRVARR